MCPPPPPPRKATKGAVVLSGCCRNMFTKCLYFFFFKHWIRNYASVYTSHVLCGERYPVFHRALILCLAEGGHKALGKQKCV